MKQKMSPDSRAEGMSGLAFFTAAEIKFQLAVGTSSLRIFFEICYFLFHYNNLFFYDYKITLL